MRFTVLPAAATVAVLSFALSACGGDNPSPPPVDTPTESPSATPESTPSQAPSKAPPSSPPADRKNAITPGAVDPAVAAEATAFVGTFIKTIDQASTSGEFGAVKKLYTNACTGCKSTVRSLERVYNDGGRIEGGAYTNPRFTVGDSSGGTVLLVVDSTIAAYKIINASGKAVQNEKAKPDVSNFFVRKDTSGWRVVAWT